jgi:5-methyltetrahydrofolate--homocysteine methyltransferase
MPIAAAHARGEENSGGFASRRLQNALALDWRTTSAEAAFLGTRVFDDYSVAELIDYIDWSPFFSTWELTGKFPAILNDEKFGEAARALYEDARAMLGKIVKENWFRAAAIVGFWPAHSDGDDILVGAEGGEVLHSLRQQLARREGRANVALADFIAPKDSGRQDYIGAFVVTAGIGEDVIADRFKHANDDYSSIMVKALADRLAELSRARMHQRVRKGFGATRPTRRCRARRRGKIPRHPSGAGRRSRITPKGDAVPADRRRADRREADRVGVAGASVSGLWARPRGAICVGKIERDQVEDYAARKGWSVAEAERWLAPILNYDPLALAKEAAE